VIHLSQRLIDLCCLADLVGVAEGVLSNLTHGHVPNIFGEPGWKAEWRHNRKSLVTRVVVGTVIAFAYLRSCKDDSKAKKRRRIGR
jgi:hypothetical protein